MRLVLDASVIVKWAVEEDGSDLAATLIDADVAAPDLLIPELATVLCRKVRNRELSVEAATETAAAFLRFPVELVPSRALFEQALLLATLMEHSAYDCFYLALAIRRGRPLVTADVRFVNKARNLPSAADWVGLLVRLDEAQALL